jgi:hypothetical protein
VAIMPLDDHACYSKNINDNYCKCKVENIFYCAKSDFMLNVRI